MPPLSRIVHQIAMFSEAVVPVSTLVSVKVTPKFYIFKGLARPLMTVSVKVTTKSFIYIRCGPNPHDS